MHVPITQVCLTMQVLLVSSGYQLALRLLVTSSTVLLYSFYMTNLMLTLYDINSHSHCLKPVAYRKLSKQLIGNLVSKFHNKECVPVKLFQ
jgi:hypothetical protein